MTKQGWWKTKMAQLEVSCIVFFRVLLVLGELLYVSVFVLMPIFVSTDFTNFVITNNIEQKQSTSTQYFSSEISWKANSHDAIPVLHHLACCSKSDRSDAFTAHLCVSYKAPQIIPIAPLLPLYPAKCVQVDLFKFNPAASRDHFILYLLSPAITDLGLSPKKNIYFGAFPATLQWFSEGHSDSRQLCIITKPKVYPWELNTTL